MTEQEMVGQHHQLNGHQFEQAPGDGEGQGSLVCSSKWGRKEWDTNERLNNKTYRGFPGGTNGTESDCQCKRHRRYGFDPTSGSSPTSG